jgi:drug/metabolite transporter (DMT)-like permease
MPLPFTSLFTLPYESFSFWYVPILLLVASEVVADVLGKEWTIRKNKLLFFLALAFYIIGSAFWLSAVSEGSGLARGAMFFEISAIFPVVLLGVFYYREKLNKKQTAGIFLGILSLFMLVV